MLAVTRPIEQTLLEVPGIRRVRSTTFRGATEISGQFEPSTDMIVALQQAQGRLAEARQSLPADLELTVERLTPAAFPFLSVNLTGPLPASDLYDYGFYVMRPSLSRVPGVGAVDPVERHRGSESSSIREAGSCLAGVGEVADA